ncbi:unnamed protein product [Malus baccata var. baccata]
MPELWFSSPGYKEGGKGEESFTLCELLLADISFSWKVSKLCCGAVNKPLRESTSQPGWCCFSVPESCLCFRLVQYPDFQVGGLRNLPLFLLLCFQDLLLDTMDRKIPF